MKPSLNAPSRATRARVPSSDRASRSSHLEEGPALRVPGAPCGPACVGASLEPQGSSPSSSSSCAGGCHATMKRPLSQDERRLFLLVGSSRGRRRRRLLGRGHGSLRSDLQVRLCFEMWCARRYGIELLFDRLFALTGSALYAEWPGGSWGPERGAWRRNLQDDPRGGRRGRLARGLRLARASPRPSSGLPIHALMAHAGPVRTS